MRQVFANFESDDNRRPDIIIHNPYGGGPQIIVDVADTGVNGQARRSDLDVDQPLQYRFNQKKAKYAQVAQEHNLSFVPETFSHTGQIHQAVLDLMHHQIKLKLELIYPHTQESKIQETLRFWLVHLTCDVNSTAFRSILAGASSLVDSTNTMLTEVCTYEQCDENLVANSAAAHKFIEDMELSMVNQEHMRL